MASRVPHADKLERHADKLERFLLRWSVGAMEADRSACLDCGRTPLTGEQVHLYDGRRRGIVCELCRPLRREQPLASEIVRHCEHGHTVRLTCVRPSAEEPSPQAAGAEPRAPLTAR
jgi:hypothetical protein